MKKLIINLSSIDMEKEHMTEKELFDTLTSTLEDNGFPNVRLSRLVITEDNDSIIQAAKRWNGLILDDLMAAVDAVRAPFEMDSNVTHELSLAARAADNAFTPYGHYGLLLDNGCGYPNFYVVLEDKEKENILSNPGDYVMVSFSAY